MRKEEKNGVGFFLVGNRLLSPKIRKATKKYHKKKHLLAEVQWKLSDLVFYFDFCCFQKKRNSTVEAKRGGLEVVFSKSLVENDYLHKVANLQGREGVLSF